MKKLLVLCFVFSFPFITYASWWNPFSWGQRAPSQPVSPPTEQLPQVPQPAAIPSSAPAPAPVIQTQVVTKTVTVKDPTEAATIAELTKQVADLKDANHSLFLQAQQIMVDDAAKINTINSYIQKYVGLVDQCKAQLSAQNASGLDVAGMNQLIHNQNDDFEGQKQLQLSNLCTFEATRYSPSMAAYCKSVGH